MVITRTPFRISFFGGGTDHPKWFLNHGGKVLGTTIDKYCYVSLRYLPPFFPHKHRIVYSKTETVMTVDEIQNPVVHECLKDQQINRGVEVHHEADLPTRTGVATSSAFTVGLLNAIYALKGEMVPKEWLYTEAIDIEQNKIKDVVGSQDQIFAAMGGFNQIDFLRSGETVITPIIMSKNKLKRLQDNLLLFFTGFTRFSSNIESDKLKNFNNRKTDLFAMMRMVEVVYDLLRENKFDDFGLLLNEAWMKKKSLSSLVSNSEIDVIYEKARKAGALGGKILGAGGGGFMLLYVPVANQFQVRLELKELLEIPFAFENTGSQVIFHNSEND